MGEGERVPQTRAQEASGPGRISESVVHDGRIVRLSLDRVRFPDGSEGTLEMIRHRGASAILPLMGHPSDEDPDVLLLRQYRYAADGFIYEVPAGVRDPTDSTWEECAARELTEETGFRAQHLREVSRIYTTPGFTDEVIHLFVAWGLTPDEAEGDADEFIEVISFPLSRALAMVEDGEIVDGKSVCTLLLAHRLLPTLDPDRKTSPNTR
jgi:ADP-ribose pyrophosphatase